MTKTFKNAVDYMFDGLERRKPPALRREAV